MTRLPERNKKIIETSYVFGDSGGFGIKAPLEQYNNWFSDGVVMATTVLCVGFLFYVTIGF
jgi:hypothetical protein